jgi:hypothetical protein
VPDVRILLYDPLRIKNAIPTDAQLSTVTPRQASSCMYVTGTKNFTISYALS